MQRIYVKLNNGSKIIQNGDLFCRLTLHSQIRQLFLRVNTINGMKMFEKLVNSKEFMTNIDKRNVYALNSIQL